MDNWQQLSMDNKSELLIIKWNKIKEIEKLNEIKNKHSLQM